MGIIHIPRVLMALRRGWVRGRALEKQGIKAIPPVGWEHRHVHPARVGLFDVDYVGHMNNAAYLAHGEYARWELSAQHGLLQGIASKKLMFYVTGNVIRYRREMRPLFRSFLVESYISAIDERDLYMTHNFRYQESHRIRAQLLVKAAIIHPGGGREKSLVPPHEFLVQECGFDEEIVQSVTYPHGHRVSHPDLLDRYQDLDAVMRQVAAADDESHTTTTKSSRPGTK